MIAHFKAFETVLLSNLHSDSNDDISRISSAACAHKQTEKRKKIRTEHEKMRNQALAIISRLVLFRTYEFKDLYNTGQNKQNWHFWDRYARIVNFSTFSPQPIRPSATLFMLSQLGRFFCNYHTLAWLSITIGWYLCAARQSIPIQF